MTPLPTLLIRAWKWAATHRPAWGALATIAWAAIIYPFVHDLPTAVLCGAAFGTVSALTLPAPPDRRD